MSTWRSLQLLACICAALPAAAVEGQTAFGIRAGVGVAGVNADAADQRTDLAAGILLGFALTDRVAVQPEVWLLRRGASGFTHPRFAPDAAAPDPVDLRVDYAEFPLLLRLGFPMERMVPSLFLGPSLGVTIGCELTGADGAGQECADAITDGHGLTARTPYWSMVVGGGLDLPWGDGMLMLDLRAVLGLNSVSEADSTPVDAEHTVYTVTLGFALPVG